MYLIGYIDSTKRRDGIILTYISTYLSKLYILAGWLSMITSMCYAVQLYLMTLCLDSIKPSRIPTHILRLYHGAYQVSRFSMSSNENISALLAVCEGNPLVTSGFPSQRPITSPFRVVLSLAFCQPWYSILLSIYTVVTEVLYEISCCVVPCKKSPYSIKRTQTKICYGKMWPIQSLWNK